jgi:hypothetical protein
MRKYRCQIPTDLVHASKKIREPALIDTMFFSDMSVKGAGFGLLKYIKDKHK